VFGGTDEDIVHSVDRDAQTNRLLLGGYFKGDIDVDPGTGVQSYTSAGNYDGFVCELDANLQLQWSHQVGGATLNRLRSVRYQPGTGQIISGDFITNTTIGATTLTSNGLSDIYLARYYDVTIGIEETNAEMNMTYDGTNRALTVQFNGESGLLRLSDISGREVWHAYIRGGEQILFANGLPAGVYIAELVVENKRKCSKMIQIQ